MSLPTVAIIGRPNVGKSSLFNRFLQKQLAVVEETPGVTRDRNYAECDWAGRRFRLVDTGGIVTETDDIMDKLIYDQTEFAINEAHLVLLLVDTKVGIDTTDRQIAQTLLKAGRPTLLVANKADSEASEFETAEFYKLGLGEPHPVSATVGRGVGDLLDALVAALPDEEVFEDDADAIRVALVGRPNVGKSSFINKLVGSERLIVSSIAGTTRDSVDTTFDFEGQRYVLIDTAGLRRSYKVREHLEFYTTLRTDRAIDDCDVAVVLIDAVDGITSQDQRVLQSVLEKRRPVILAVNKWDLVEKDTHTADEFTREIYDSVAHYSYVPIIYISALSGQRVPKVMTMVQELHAENHKRIGTSELNDFLAQTIARKHPPAKSGKFIKFMYVTQSEVAPPTFLFFVNHPRLIAKSYIYYLTNQLRESFGFSGVPIRLKFRQK